MNSFLNIQILQPLKTRRSSYLNSDSFTLEDLWVFFIITILSSILLFGIGKTYEVISPLEQKMLYTKYVNIDNKIKLLEERHSKLISEQKQLISDSEKMLQDLKNQKEKISATRQSPVPKQK